MGPGWTSRAWYFHSPELFLALITPGQTKAFKILDMSLTEEGVSSL